MGRRMFDAGVGPWGDNPLFHAPCFVVSHRSAVIEGPEATHLRFRVPR
jgi:hypothetical protein